MNIENGQATFGSAYVGFGLQLYWPRFKLEYQKHYDRELGVMVNDNIVGFHCAANTNFRVCANEFAGEYAFGFHLFGFGCAVQYVRPEKPKMDVTPGEPIK